MALISDFSGGIATGVDEFYLSPRHSTALVNANVNRIGLIGVSNEKLVKACRRWFYEFPIADTEPQELFITASDNYRSYTEFNGRLCYSNGGPVCRYTEGDMNEELPEEQEDFKWYDMGAIAPEGHIDARPLVISDLDGTTATIREQADGHINIDHVKYRVVNTSGNLETIYIKEFEDNTGEAVVDWVVPADTEVYRQLVNIYAEPVDKYLLVNRDPNNEDNLLRTFTDGLTRMMFDTVCERNSTVDNRASSRMVMYQGDGYTLQYKVEKTIEVEEETTRTCDNCGVCCDVIVRTNVYVTKCTIETMYKVGEDRYIPMQVRFVKEIRDAKSHKSAIASAFVFMDMLYLMITVGNETSVYSLIENDEIYRTDTVKIDNEFHHSSTVEAGNSVYFFDLRNGKVAFFNGAFFTVKSTTKYPYATAKTSVFSGKNGIVYALVNEKTEANLYAFTLPDMTPSLTGKARIRVPRLSTLGGTSGSDMTEGDYIILPVSKKLYRYNPDTHTLRTLPIAVVYPNGSTSGFVYANRNILMVSGNVIAWCREEFIEDSEEMDVECLNGSILYNVGQQTQDGVDGPIMVMEHDEVEIENGHMRVDLSNITHTNELRLYRTGGYLTRYTMVEDVDPKNLYIDRRDDVSIALGREGLYEEVEAPPEGMKWLTAHRGTLFGAVGNKLYWSEPGQLNYWDSVQNMLLLDREVTGLISGFNGLIIFMRGSIRLLAGDSPETYVLRTVSTARGTVKSHGIQPAGGGAMFMTSEGMCFTDGITVKDLSYDMLGSIDFVVIDSAVTSRSYFVLVENWMETNHEFVVLKQDINKEALFTTLDGTGMEALGTVDGQLAHTSDGYLYESYGGDGTRILHYKSGKITLNELTMIKEWDRIRLTGEFVGLMTITLDDEIVLSDTVDTAEHYNVHIPKSVNKGKAMSLEIEGSGDIYSIEYSITGRSTTK